MWDAEVVTKNLNKVIDRNYYPAPSLGRDSGTFRLFDCVCVWAVCPSLSLSLSLCPFVTYETATIAVSSPEP